MAEKEAIGERVKEIILKILQKTAAEIDEDVSLRAVGLDSIRMIELITGLETEFNIRIDDREITQKIFENVSSLSCFIAEKLG